MTDAPEPAALNDSDVAVRAATARELAARGTLDDVGRLLGAATGDRSPSVRLYTAAATAAVLRRARREGPLPKAIAEQVLDALRRYDPQGNPSVLLALGAVGPSVRGRLGRLLKDPHSDVRQAAVAAIRAEALSALSLGDEELVTQVGSWASTRNLQGDVRLDLGRLLGEMGHPDGEAILLGISGAVRDPEGVLDEARARVAARRDRQSYLGVWRTQRPEVLVPPDPKAAVPWVGVSAEDWFADGSHDAITWQDDGSPTGPEGRARLLFVGVPGQEGQAALQTATATRFATVGKDLAGWVDRSIGDLRGVEPLCRVLHEQLDGVEGAVAPRARALLLWRGGDAAAAGEALETLLSAKKPKVDLHWWRANVALSEGDLDLAREQAQAYLAKAPKKGTHREAAEGLVDSLKA